MTLKTLQRASLALCLGTCAGSALAHISYSGRAFGTITGNSNITISNQAVTSNFGWADASDQALHFDPNYAAWHTVDSASYSSATFTDGVDSLFYGDSHKGKAFSFHLDATTTVRITEQSNATATPSSVGGLTAAFSVYRGLAAISPFPPSQTGLPPSADHDFSAASQTWRASQVRSVTGNASYDHLASQGSWNALGNWSIGGDGDLPGDFSQLSHFEYVGSAAATVHDGVARGVFTLGAGDYTIFVGGNDLSSKNATDAIKAYGLALNVTAVPEPGAGWLMLLGLPLLRLRRRP